MKATRKTQPYRKGKARPAGPSLSAMLRGMPASGRHPSTAQRRNRKRRAAISRRP